MSRKSNVTPEDYVAVCTAPRERRLIALNAHLREAGIDARYSSGKDEATIRVPPAAKVTADFRARRYVAQRPIDGLRFNT